MPDDTCALNYEKRTYVLFRGYFCVDNGRCGYVTYFLLSGWGLVGGVFLLFVFVFGTLGVSFVLFRSDDGLALASLIRSLTFSQVASRPSPTYLFPRQVFICAVLAASVSNGSVGVLALPSGPTIVVLPPGAS